jgi:hypothetical protein
MKPIALWILLWLFSRIGLATEPERANMEAT